MWRVMLSDIKRIPGAFVPVSWVGVGLGLLLAVIVVAVGAVAFSPALVVGWLYPEWEGLALALNMAVWFLAIWAMNAHDRAP